MGSTPFGVCLILALTMMPLYHVHADTQETADTDGLIEVHTFTITDIKDSSRHYDLSVAMYIEGWKLHIGMESDSLELLKVKYLNSAVVESEVFLQLTLDAPGGNGSSSERTVVVCAASGKLVSALDIESKKIDYDLTPYSDRATIPPWEGAGDREYYATVTITHPETSYIAEIGESGKFESINDSAKNVSYTESTILHFDSEKLVYCNEYVELNDTFHIDSNHFDSTATRYFQGAVPCIALKEDRYLLIENSWYVQMDKRYLFQL